MPAHADHTYQNWPLLIGAYLATPANTANGVISDLRVYSDEKTADDITDYHNMLIATPGIP